MNEELISIPFSKTNSTLHLVSFLICFCISINAFGQLSNYGIYPGGLVLESYNPTSTAQNYLSGLWDIDSILDSGTPVLLRLDATWCAPSWVYHQSGVFGDLYNSTGWGGTNEVAIFAIETDSFTSDSLLEGGPNSMGNWVTGTDFPLVNHDNISIYFNFSFCPSVALICTDRSIIDVGQATELGLISAINSCISPAPYTNDLKLVGNSSDYSSVSCRGNIMPIEIKMIVQNYSVIDINGYYNLEIFDSNGISLLGNGFNLSLSPYEIAEVNLELITPTLIGINNYTAVITTPNDDLSNDTLPFQIDILIAEEMYINDNQINLDIAFDAHPEDFGMVFDQGIPTSNNLTNTYQNAVNGTFTPLILEPYGSINTAFFNTNITIQSNDGCFYFMFVDSIGQGINYLTSGNGATISTTTGGYCYIDGSWEEGIFKIINFIDVASIKEEFINEISIYPNPTQDLLDIQLGHFENTTINVYNTSNQLIFQKNNINSPSYQFEFNQPAGIYIVEVNSEGKTRRFKLVKE